MAAFDARMTRTPTPLRSSSASSIFTRSSRCLSSESSALGSSSSAASMVSRCLPVSIESRFSASMARTMSALFSSSWLISRRTWLSTDFAEPSRPSSALLISLVMVLSWPTPPPLSSRLSAPRTSSTSGLRPDRSSGITSPSPRSRGAGARLGRAERDELLAEQAGLAELGDRVVGQLHVLAQLEGHLGDRAVEADVGHLADVDVVDLHRRLRHQVEHVAELHGDRDRVLAGVGAAGQRQAVDAEVAGCQQGQHERRQQRSAPGLAASSRTLLCARPRGRRATGRSGRRRGRRPRTEPRARRPAGRAACRAGAS